jgi:hypothetical protein
MAIPPLLLLLLALPGEAPSIGAGFGGGAMYSVLPCLAANITGEIPLLANTSVQVAGRVQTFPFPLLGGPTPLGSWRLSSSVGIVQSFPVGPVAFGAGAAVTAGAVTVTNLDGPPWAPEVGAGPLAQFRWSLLESFALRVRLLVPFTVAWSPSGAYFAAHPELTFGASFEFPSPSARAHDAEDQT